MIKSALQVPRMNAHCERVIGSIRHEVRDHILVMGEPTRAKSFRPPGCTTTSIGPTKPATDYHPMP